MGAATHRRIHPNSLLLVVQVKTTQGSLSKKDVPNSHWNLLTLANCIEWFRR